MRAVLPDEIPERCERGELKLLLNTGRSCYPKLLYEARMPAEMEFVVRQITSKQYELSVRGCILTK